MIVSKVEMGIVVKQEDVSIETLRDIAGSEKAKKTFVKDISVTHNQYMFMVSDFIRYCSRLKEEEFALLTISLHNWMNRRHIIKFGEKLEIGHIVHTDFGMTYSAECSYPHPCIVLEIVGNMVFVVPVTTSKEKLSKGFHPIKNPNGNKFIRVIKDGEDGFTYESAVLLSNASSISMGRLINIIGKMNNVNDENSIFREIKSKIFKSYFKKENSNTIRLESENAAMKEVILNLQKEKEALIREIESFSMVEETG